MTAEGPQKERVRRILLALDYARDMAVLEAAERLALALEASLEALFVEDSELLRLAQLPFAREISFGSAIARPMELARLERELKSRAAEMERIIRSRAKRGRTQWTFTVTRGALPSAVLAISPPADLYILPRIGGSFAPRADRRRGSVASLLDGSPTSLRALEAAVALSDGNPLYVLVPPTTDGGKAVQAAAMPLLSRLRHGATFIPLADSAVANIAAAVRAQRADLLVIGQAALPDDPATLRQLQEQIGTPLVIAT